MARNAARFLIALAGCCWIASASATYIVSDAHYTANSLTFTIDGDMTGYAVPGDALLLSIRMLGDIYNGPANLITQNIWTASPFDNETHFSTPGNLYNDGATVPYSWNPFTSSLADSVATSNTVTVSWAVNVLDVNAVDPLLDFVWGNGNDISPYTLIQSVQAQAQGVPEPGTLALLGASIVLMGLRHRARR